MNHQELEARLASAIQERDNLIREANSRIGFLSGQIAMIEELLKPEEEKEAEDADD